jgi:hypothetical protein
VSDRCASVKAGRRVTSGAKGPLRAHKRPSIDTRSILVLFVAALSLCSHNTQYGILDTGSYLPVPYSHTHRAVCGSVHCGAAPPCRANTSTKKRRRCTHITHTRDTVCVRCVHAAHLVPWRVLGVCTHGFTPRVRRPGRRAVFPSAADSPFCYAIRTYDLTCTVCSVATR